MKYWRWAALVIVASGCGASDSAAPAAAGPVNIAVDAGLPGAVKFRIVGPGPAPTSVTNVPLTEYAMAEAHGDTLTVLVFGNGLAGTVGTVTLPMGTHPERYQVTVIEAADTLNQSIQPATVRLRLVSGGGQ